MPDPQVVTLRVLHSSGAAHSTQHTAHTYSQIKQNKTRLSRCTTRPCPCMPGIGHFFVLHPLTVYFQHGHCCLSLEQDTNWIQNDKTLFPLCGFGTSAKNDDKNFTSLGDLFKIDYLDPLVSEDSPRPSNKRKHISLHKQSASGESKGGQKEPKGNINDANVSHKRIPVCQGNPEQRARRIIHVLNEQLEALQAVLLYGTVIGSIRAERELIDRLACFVNTFFW